jgi:hypothetical protein
MLIVGNKIQTNFMQKIKVNKRVINHIHTIYYKLQSVYIK